MAQPAAASVEAVFHLDMKTIDNITEYTCQFRLGLVRIKQEFIESSALIWQRKSALRF